MYPVAVFTGEDTGTFFRPSTALAYFSISQNPANRTHSEHKITSALPSSRRQA